MNPAFPPPTELANVTPAFALGLGIIMLAVGFLLGALVAARPTKHESGDDRAALKRSANLATQRGRSGPGSSLWS